MVSIKITGIGCCLFAFKLKKEKNPSMSTIVEENSDEQQIRRHWTTEFIGADGKRTALEAAERIEESR